MMTRRATLRALGAAAVAGSSLSRAVASDVDYEDVRGAWPVNYEPFGTRPAEGTEEQKAGDILSHAPSMKPLIETAQYFEKLKDANAEGLAYNAQWPVRWNPVIVGFYQSTSLPKKYIYQHGDTIAWCAAFVNWCLDRAGYQTTADALSGSFRLGRGLGTPTTNPERGDLVVFKDADPDAAKVGHGHVAIFLAKGPVGISVLGGNQHAGKRYSSVNTTVFAESSKSLILDSYRSLATIPKRA